MIHRVVTTVHASSITPPSAGAEPFPVDPLIPAYRCNRPTDGGLSIRFRCPFCHTVHTHGLPAGEGLIQSRGSHCHNKMSPLFGKNYRLLIVGEIAWDQRVPEFFADDIRTLNAVVQSK
jgi:hypothetical protein